MDLAAELVGGSASEEGGMVKHMQLFHISDILSVTTGRLVSYRHIDGVYAILNFMTGDSLFTHQLPRASRECESSLRAQFPNLMEDSPRMPERLADMDRRIKAVEQDKEKIAVVVRDWVEELRLSMEEYVNFCLAYAKNGLGNMDIAGPFFYVVRTD